MILTASILRRNELVPEIFMNSTAGISPILLGSPFSFVSKYAVPILGEKQNFIQVASLCSCVCMLFNCIGYLNKGCIVVLNW